MRALFALAVGAFAIGCTEFVVIGILPTLAQEINVSLVDAGYLVTWYAAAVIIGAPLLPAITASFPRKTLLILLMAIFTAGNLLAAIATSYTHLVWARIVTGTVHGAFFAIGTSVAMHVVPKEKQASAIALMFSGLTVALVTGVPLGTFLASSFSWRMTFYVVTSCGLIATLAMIFFVPNRIRYPKPKESFKEFSLLLCPKMLMAYAMTVLCFGGPFIAYTYIAAILRQITGFGEYWIGPLLVFYGIAVAVGNIWGGKVADRKGPLHALRYFVSWMIAIMIAFYFGQEYKIIAVPLLLAWGVFGFAVCPGLQFFVMILAKRLKLETADVAAGINIAAFNMGIVGGSSIGSLVVDHVGLSYTSLASAGAVVLAFLVVWFASNRVKRLLIT
jgi:predicted MFS family arabinose efflux permease